MRIALLFTLCAFGSLLVTACNSVGATTCTGVGTNVTNTGCTLTVDHCNDSHVYAESCGNGKCSCLIDGKIAPVGTKATTCPMQAGQINTDCSWSLSINQQSGA